ncbi:Rhs-family protein [Minicystis rosea]|nr:Rhs-family protein [Minicystis rosea]
MATKHIANREPIYIAINSTPDMCVVDGDVVPFDIYQTLDNEQAAFSTNVFARKQPVLLAGSIIKGVIGNAGKGLESGVAAGEGHIKVLRGSSKVLIQGREVARHLDPIEMNGET